MYRPTHFAEERIEVLYALMRERPFATLVTQGKAGPGADHLPLHLTPDGRLQGHVARANPIWRDAADTDVLAIFHGPQAYVTPSWYATKREHGRAVPTWNYVVVHARGRLRAVEDAAWLRQQLDDLVEHHESGFDHPWRVDDAPADYIEKMLAAIVGIEIEITGLSGKWKISQNQPAINREGVVAGLRQQGTTDSQAMAGLVDAIE
ncbi:MAG: FMN-binding negative transcriptional regulator [Sulfuritalea sp.]|nr:FMN-binding negative transcriptional regulator [Sulfuritalea sp.]